MEMIENEFGEEWIKVEDHNIINDFNYCLDETEFGWNYLAKVKEPENVSPHYVLSISGGKNGDGNWIIYLLDLINAIVHLKELYWKVEVLSIKTDIPDDTFEVRIVCGDRK